MTHYYTTQPFLAWCVSRVFFGSHHVYLSAAFFPYRLPNPKSSNPLLIYQDLYAPWKDRDPFDKFITQLRINLRNAVRSKEKDGSINSSMAHDLKQICAGIDIEFFYPIVYRVDMDGIVDSRKTLSGSGLSGSSEILVKDLRDGEFDTLFLDHGDGAEFDSLKDPSVSQHDALTALKGRC